MAAYKTLNQDFFKAWSADMAYVLGYFAADGSMLVNNRGGYYIEFTSTDRILLEQVQKVTGLNHKISERERGGNPKTAYRLQIGSKTWFQDLTLLGFTQNKSNTLTFPQVPKEYFPHFVRGYFDGDGCAYFKSHFAKDRNKERWIFNTLFTSGSKVFLMTLWDRLRRCGITGGHISAKTNNAVIGGYDLVFSLHDSLALYRIMYHTTGVSDLFLPRKREKLEEAIELLKLDK